VYHKEDLGNRYFVGEVYAIHKELIPNARRDFFIDNDVCTQFSRHLRDLFHRRLYNLYYDFSNKNSAIKTIQDLEKINEKIGNNNLDNDSKEKLISEKTKLEKKAGKAKTILSRLANKYQGQVLGETIKNSGFVFDQSDKKEDIFQENNKITETKPSTQEKSLSPQETTLLKKVYNVIRQNFIKETAEELIQKIEEELKR